MPVNRNALLRHQVIDKCLRNRGRKWTWQDILEKVNEALFEDNPKSNGIGKTTIFEDFKDIEYRVYNGEIKRIAEGKAIYYSYADSNYSINNQPLSESEAKQLKSAVMVLSRFKGLPQFDWINEIVPIIEAKMGLLKIEKEVMSFDSNIDYSGAYHIPTLFSAIINHRVLKLVYKNFKNPTPYDAEIHPQYLKQFNSRWFILSFMDNWGDKPQIHALDRIESINESNTKYRSVKEFDWDNYFAEIIGVTRFDGNPITIKLLILDAEQASYIETKPLHQSQKKIKKTEQGYETSITVIPNYELEKLILSFGDRIKVLSPSSLKTKIKERVEALQKLYLDC